MSIPSLAPFISFLRDPHLDPLNCRLQFAQLIMEKKKEETAQSLFAYQNIDENDSMDVEDDDVKNKALTDMTEYYTLQLVYNLLLDRFDGISNHTDVFSEKKKELNV